MIMKRRSFIKNIGSVGAAMTVGGVPVQLMSQNRPLQRLAGHSNNDRVLVILQMHGGNDGLNTFIPINQYDQYYNRRENIAIPATGRNRKYIELDSTLPLEQQVGLHPDMGDFKALYDSGKATVVQGVSYKFNNGSHFRGRDIQFMGGDHDEYLNSGWIGRYLQNEISPLEYPKDFPNDDNKDPLAIEMGRDVSLVFHQDKGVSAAYSLGSNPDAFAKLIGKLNGFNDEEIDPRGIPPEFLKSSGYGQEMDFLLNLEHTSEEYALRLQEIYNQTKSPSTTYPDKYPFLAPEGAKTNRLSGQLQLIARLLEGGVKTKVFLVKIGGFDTHADQVEAFNSTMGLHGALLYHICSSIRAFQQDLATRGIEDRVLTMTTSEFGRRIDSNGSYGTDHGIGAPVMLFGRGVIPGVRGNNPNISDPSKGNVEMQFDYRQVYNSILRDWFLVDQSIINQQILFRNFHDGTSDVDTSKNYEPLNVATPDDVSSAYHEFVRKRFGIRNIFPIPAETQVTIDFVCNHVGETHFTVFSSEGKLVKKLSHKIDNPGDQRIEVDVEGLASGIHSLQIKLPNGLKITGQLVKQ